MENKKEEIQRVAKLRKTGCLPRVFFKKQSGLLKKEPGQIGLNIPFPAIPARELQFL